MDNRSIIEAWKNKKLRNQGLTPNPAGPSSVALKQVQQNELTTSPQPLCSYTCSNTPICA